MRIGMVAVLIVGVVHSLSLKTSTPSFGEMNDFVRNTFALPTKGLGTRTITAYGLQVTSMRSSLFWVGGGIADRENFGNVSIKPALMCTWNTAL